MVDIPEALQHKLGPLEAWQWGALAGGAILVYRVVSSQGHQSTGVGTVTLTPNNQPDVSGSGTDTIGSVLSGFAATGLFPDEFSITLPNGTVVTFKGGRIVSTTPAGSTPTDTTPPPDPSLGGIASPILPLPQARPGGPVIPGVTPNPLPWPHVGPVVPAPPAPPAGLPHVWPALPGRPGGATVGANPSVLPGTRPGGASAGANPMPLPWRSGPASVYIPSLPTGAGAGASPAPLPVRGSGGATGGTPGHLPGTR